ncbi:EAL domain-containing protein [Sneathiella sp. P13V-1]|uniref:EAL domain-containing protein n=1 Tax=Sneathiella sp. P13V-1 TaxID=2697366 RepID=UPI00187B752F|nr:GGDEF domain-containing phosphodiesterase [Sneathiella sp. P13V-1]MBE7637158.1 EAL domain-containing protein [Sneathiella sp. P13V-1]
MVETSKLNELRDDKERFVAFSFAAADLLIELDKKGNICFVSGASKGITGKSIEELMGSSFVDILDPLDQRVVSYLLSNMKEGQRITPVSARMSSTDVFAVIGACSLPRTHGHIYLTINVTGLPAAQSLSVKRDKETGLLEKNDFLQLANDQLSIAADTGQDLELTLLHLDNLKDMADATPESQMDEFFEQMGSILRSYSVGGDSAGRIDGDKYGVLHSKNLDGKVLQEKVENISEEISPGNGVKVSPSSVSLDKGNLSKENASNALMFVINSFVDAEDGTFEIESLADGLQGRMENTMNRISKLKSVFLKHDFNLVYQPIVHLVDEKPHHYEVLCRFKEGESPFETVTFAEEVGIILDLDLAVYKKSVEYLKSFKPKGQETPHLAVNISGHSIESNEFIDSLMQLVNENKDVSGNIGLELTETSQVKDLVRAERVIQKFREKGIHVSLDDMGAGAASFQYIRALNTDFVKIDGGYVRDVLNNDRDKAILRSMSQLCHDLKIGTIAEMVETKEHVDLLRSLRVDYGQGWLFSKPLPEIEAPKVKRSITMNARRKGYKTGWG